MDKPPIDIKDDLTPAVQGFTNFMGNVFGPASKEIGDLLGDRVSLWKRLNALEVAQMYQKKIEERGLEPEELEPLKPGHAISLIEAAAYEDEVSVQNLWAELLINAQDPKSDVKVEKAFIALLREFGPCETALFQLSAKYNGLIGLWQLDPSFVEGVAQDYEDNLEPFTDQQRSAAVMNLRRLGIARVNVAHDQRFDIIRHVHLGGSLRGPLTTVDERGLERLLKWLTEQIEVAGGAVTGDLPPGSGFKVGTREILVPELAVLLTPLGQRLATAVSLEPVAPMFANLPSPGERA